MILDVSSGAISQLSDGSDYVYEAAGSPDGARIAFVSQRGGKDRLWVMNADGSDPRLLNPDLDRIRGPVWSPNGSFILVTDWSIDGAYPRAKGASMIFCGFGQPLGSERSRLNVT